MKANKTALKIVTLCVLCAVMALSGCLDSDDIRLLDDTVDSIDVVSKDVVYKVDLILGHHGEPGVMEVEMYEDGTAEIITITGSGEVVEVGTWQFYRESADHKMYDITTDDTELRLAFATDSANTIAYLYEGGFKKCGEPFYGTWEQLGSDDADEVINANLDTIPLTAMFTGKTPSEYDRRRVILEEDGTMELCNYNECLAGTWKLTSRTPTSRTYKIVIKDRRYPKVLESEVTIRDDFTVEHEYPDTVYYGTWEEGVDRSWEGIGRAPAPTPTPTKVKTSSKIPDLPPLTVWIDLGGFDHHVDDASARIILNDDGTLLMCDSAFLKGLCYDGTWVLVDRDESVYTIDASVMFMGGMTLNPDGTANFISNDDTTEGTWTSGIDRSWGGGHSSPVFSKDMIDQDSEDMPITAMIKGALADDCIRYILESGGSVEECSRGECIYPSWELSDKQDNFRTYVIDATPTRRLTLWASGEATLVVDTALVIFKGTWEDGIDRSRCG